MKRIILAVLLILATPITAHAQSFLLGAMVGGALSGSQYGSRSSEVLYSASAEVWNGVDPLSMRQIVHDGCYGRDQVSAGLTLGQMFSRLIEQKAKPNPAASPSKEYTVLQVVRVVHPTHTQCASIWFTFYEK